jgi:hypothetical protein
MAWRGCQSATRARQRTIDWAAVQLRCCTRIGTEAMQRGNMCNRHYTLQSEVQMRRAATHTMVNVQHATCDNSTQHATNVLWHAVACLDLCHLNGKAALDSAVVLEHCTRRGPASHSSRARTHIDCSFARTFYTQMAVHSRQATRHLPLCVCACECAQFALSVSDFSCQPHFRRRLLSKALAWLGLAWLGLAVSAQAVAVTVSVSGACAP